MRERSERGGVCKPASRGPVSEHDVTGESPPASPPLQGGRKKCSQSLGAAPRHGARASWGADPVSAPTAPRAATSHQSAKAKTRATQLSQL